MSFGFFSKSKDVSEGPQENVDPKPSGSSKDSSLVAWCRKNKGSYSVAGHLLDLVEGEWTMPDSDDEAVA